MAQWNQISGTKPSATDHLITFYSQIQLRGLEWAWPRLEDAEACFNPIGGDASSTCGSFSSNTHEHTLRSRSVQRTRGPRQLSQGFYLTAAFPKLRE